MPRAAYPDALAFARADDVENAFYEALQNADVELMMSLWADEEEVVCVLPGGMRIVGVQAIRNAVETLFGRGAVMVRAHEVRRVETLGSAVHSVIEAIEMPSEEGPMTMHAVATNVYHKGPRGWRMVAHHTSPFSQEAPTEMIAVPPASALH